MKGRPPRLAKRIRASEVRAALRYQIYHWHIHMWEGELAALQPFIAYIHLIIHRYIDIFRHRHTYTDIFVWKCIVIYKCMCMSYLLHMHDYTCQTCNNLSGEAPPKLQLLRSFGARHVTCACRSWVCRGVHARTRSNRQADIDGIIWYESVYGVDGHGIASKRHPNIIISAVGLPVVKKPLNVVQYCPL